MFGSLNKLGIEQKWGKTRDRQFPKTRLLFFEFLKTRSISWKNMKIKSGTEYGIDTFKKTWKGNSNKNMKWDIGIEYGINTYRIT